MLKARSLRMWSVFSEHIDKNNSNLDLIKCDMHLLDDDFADLLNTCMDDMLDGKWRIGMYRDREDVVE